MVDALGRAKHYTRGIWRPYHGSHVTYKLSIDNWLSLSEFEENTDLWYLEFKPSSRDVWYSACGCVFDIDFKGQIQQELYMATLAKRIPVIQRLLVDVLEIIKNEMKDLPFCIYVSGSKGIHVYVKNPRGFLLIDHGDPSAITASRVNTFLQSMFSSEFLDLIDKSPYPHNKGIRPITCEHPKTQITPFMVYCSENWTSVEGCLEDSWLYWCVDSIISGTIDTTSISAIVVPQQQRLVTPTTRTTTATGELCGFFDGHLGTWINRKSGGVATEIQQGKFLVYVFEGIEGTWCPIANKIHKTRCTSWDCSYENGTCVASCFNAKCSGKRFVLRLTIPHPITKPPVQCGIDPTKIIQYENPTNSRYLPEDRLLEDIENLKSLVICSSMGSGKTRSVVKWIEKNPHLKVLVIGTRIQQIAAWFTKFTHLGFKNYEAVQGSLFNQSRLLICLNSLPRLLGAASADSFRPIANFDALIIDEADSLARWLGGPLLTESPLIFTIMQVLFASAKYVLCMDGIPTLALGEMLKQLGCLNRFHWVVFQSLRFKEWVFANNPEYFTKSYLSALES